MVRKRLIALFLMVIMLGLARSGKVYSEVQTLNEPLPVAPGRSVTGVVTNMDTVNHTLQIKDKAGIIDTIALNSSIQLMRNGQPVVSYDVSLGDTVTVKSH